MRRKMFIYPVLPCIFCYVVILRLSSSRFFYLPVCPAPLQNPVEYPWWVYDGVKGQEINFSAKLAVTLETTAISNKHLEPGGHWRPKHCRPRNNVGILVPYRNRPSQLQIFVDYMHPFLQRQNLEYTIYVIEQTETSRFNRGLLFNIGFVESKNHKGRHDCYYLHDIDLLPENDLNVYDCPKQPRHQSSSIDKFGYDLAYQANFGGVTSIKTKHFELVNGFSNLYFGWGGEDDDFFSRVKRRFDATRLSKVAGRYSMIKHQQESGNPHRVSILYKVWKVATFDGLNSLCYRVVSIDLLPKYTRIVADFNETYHVKNETNSMLTCDSAERQVSSFLNAV